MTGTCDALDAGVLDAVDPTDVTVGENWIPIQRGVKYPLSSDFLPLSPSSVPEKVRREGEGLQSISDRGSLSLSLSSSSGLVRCSCLFREERETVTTLIGLLLPFPPSSAQRESGSALVTLPQEKALGEKKEETGGKDRKRLPIYSILVLGHRLIRIKPNYVLHKNSLH